MIFELTKRILIKFIETERALVKAGNKLIIKRLERRFHVPVFVPELNQEIFLKGTVDRIDSLNGITRIVDYKTGNVAHAFDPIMS